MSSRLLALVALLAAALGEEAAESSALSSPPPPLDKTYDMGGDLADDLGTEQPPPELREAMAQMFDELDGEEHIVLFADYGLPAKSMITGGLMGILGAHYAGFGLGLFGLFLAERTSKIRFVVERDHFEIMIKKGMDNEKQVLQGLVDSAEKRIAEISSGEKPALIPDADANVNLAPEVGDLTCDWLKRQFQQPIISTVPMGWGATRDFIAEVSETLGLDIDVESVGDSRLPWYSRSVDSTYLTNKRVFIFADGTHAIAAARIARDEMGFEVVGLGTYSRERARDVRALAKEYGLEALITDDYLAVERAVEALQPELVLGTQMERHIAKRLGLPCAVISTPAHVQDYPARYSPQMGFEGANVLFDTWVHPLIMGLEEHLLTMFRDDFEFNDTAAPSHLGGEGGGAHQPDIVALTEEAAETDEPGAIAWAVSAEKELRKIPFFVRGKARRNTEHFAIENGLSVIDVETLYEAKAHYSR